MKVLVVDDDQDVRESTVLLLELLQHEGKAVGKAAEVFGILDEFDASVILHDANMPGLDLPTQMAMLQDRGKWIALFSARVDAPDLQRDLGLPGLLGKPFEFADLETLLAHAVDELGAK